MSIRHTPQIRPPKSFLAKKEAKTSQNSSYDQSVKNSTFYYSVTVRPSSGFTLGLKSTEDLLRELPPMCIEYIFTLEKQGTPAQHLQAGIVTTMRQDNVRRFILSRFPEFDANEKKYAVKVKSHKDWQILVNYCSKENDPFAMHLQTAQVIQLDDCDKMIRRYRNSSEYKNHLTPVRVKVIGIIRNAYSEENIDPVFPDNFFSKFN